jgi:hypothetical protein
MIAPVSAVIGSDGRLVVADVAGAVLVFEPPYDAPTRSMDVKLGAYDLALWKEQVLVVAPGSPEAPYWVHRFDLTGRKTGEALPLAREGPASVLRELYAFKTTAIAVSGKGDIAVVTGDTPGARLLNEHLAVVGAVGEEVPDGIMMPPRTAPMPPEDPTMLMEERSRIGRQYDYPSRVFFLQDRVVIAYRIGRFNRPPVEDVSSRDWVDILDRLGGRRVFSEPIDGRLMDVTQGGIMTVLRQTGTSEARHTWIDEYRFRS